MDEPHNRGGTFLGLAIGWAILAAFQAGYLRDLSIQATGIGAYLPGWVQGLAGLSPWAFVAVALLNALLALGEARAFTGAGSEPMLRVLRILSLAAALAYVAGALATLYYVSLAPAGL